MFYILYFYNKVGQRNENVIQKIIRENTFIALYEYLLKNIGEPLTLPVTTNRQLRGRGSSSPDHSMAVF